MRFLGLSSYRLPIALDIGYDRIKTLQLSNSGDGIHVAAWGKWVFPVGGDADPQHRTAQAVSAVRDMLRNGGFHGRKVISSLSCRHLGIKNIRLPRMPANELSKAIKWEADERFNFEVTDDQLKYLQAGTVRQGTESRNEIIMLAIPEHIINAHLEMLGAMGLRAEHIDAEPVALFRCFERHLRRADDEQTASVIVDIGLSATRVVVARGRQILFLKNIPIAGKKFTEAVAGQLNISFEEAHDLRERCIHVESAPPDGDSCEGDDQQGQDSSRRNPVDWSIHDALRSEVEQLAREVALCLRYCAVTFRGLRPTQVTLCGGEAYDSVVTRMIGEQLGVPCEFGRPFKGIDLSGAEMGSDGHGDLSEWAVCVGLGTRMLRSSDRRQEEKNARNRLSA